MPTSRIPLLSLIALSLTTLSPFAPFAHAEDKKEGKKYEIEAIKDLAYYEGEDADKVKHKLDLFLPKNHKDFPVVVFVHGGGWVIGDKNLWLHSGVGKFFAENGIGTVVVNYRLSPKVQHPEHIKDVARGVAWVHKNIKKYGGRSDQLFICGHSAGGHLTALLCTDDSYLKAEGMSLKDIKGAMPISGVYIIPTAKALSGIFGEDEEVVKKAQPIEHAREDAPPFLILFASKDLPGCGKVTSESFCKALTDKKAVAETVEIKDRDHISIVSKIGQDDPCGKAMLEFIEKRLKK